MMSDGGYERAQERGSGKARNVLHFFGTASPEEIDVEAFAEHYGLRVVSGGLEGADGRLVSDGKRGLVRVSDRVTQEARRRFVIAHELGHHLIHAAKREISLCTEGDLVRYEAGGAEPEANYFAAELLMPRVLFGPKCEVGVPSFAVIRELAIMFSTTLTSTAIQFAKHCPESCAVVWTERGVIKWFVRSTEFQFWIVKGSRVGTHALAAGSDAHLGRREEVSLSQWAEESHGAEAIEETIALPFPGARLSLLWVRT